MDKIIDRIMSAVIKVKSTLQAFGKQLARLNAKAFRPESMAAGNEDRSTGKIQVSRQYKLNAGKKILPIRRHGRQRVYRLKGYTTVAKVNRKRQSERQQRLLRRLLIGIIFILVLILLFNIYNPVRDLTEWYRIIGFDQLSDLTGSTTVSTAAGPTSIPAVVSSQTTQKTP